MTWAMMTKQSRFARLFLKKELRYFWSRFALSRISASIFLVFFKTFVFFNVTNCRQQAQPVSRFAKMWRFFLLVGYVRVRNDPWMLFCARYHIPGIRPRTSMIQRSTCPSLNTSTVVSSLPSKVGRGCKPEVLYILVASFLLTLHSSYHFFSSSYIVTPLDSQCSSFSLEGCRATWDWSHNEVCVQCLLQVRH